MRLVPVSRRTGKVAKRGVLYHALRGEPVIHEWYGIDRHPLCMVGRHSRSNGCPVRFDLLPGARPCRLCFETWEQGQLW